MVDSGFKDVHLSTIIEGVEATVALYGNSIRVVVTAEALKARFGAQGKPEAWLESFEKNAVAIKKAAQQMYKPGQATIVIQSFESPKR